MARRRNAKGGTRTHTPSRVPDPKSGASASSATFAFLAAYSGFWTRGRARAPRVSLLPPGRSRAEPRCLQAVFRRRAGRAGSRRGRTLASDARLLVTINSSTGPRSVARELIIRRAGPRGSTRHARRGRWLEERTTISSALELDNTSEAARAHASVTAAHSRA